jgi:hypothetical protein
MALASPAALPVKAPRSKELLRLVEKLLTLREHLELLSGGLGPAATHSTASCSRRSYEARVGAGSVVRHFPPKPLGVVDISIPVLPRQLACAGLGLALSFVLVGCGGVVKMTGSGDAGASCGAVGTGATASGTGATAGKGGLRAAYTITR